MERQDGAAEPSSGVRVKDPVTGGHVVGLTHLSVERVTHRVYRR